ncbi:transposase domain-containing protein [Nonomuraea turkmeniaca]|uniref:transposase domain-containing protein n=1 Tax=Nonomuraea turkmeniaca TaxID=103838 RepID=UPI001B861E25
MFAPGHLGELTQVVPFEMVDEVLAEAGGRERRLRDLPSRVVVYLLLAAGLFAELGYRQVWARLTSGLAEPGPVPSSSALAQARRRVGVEPASVSRSLLTFDTSTFEGRSVTDARVELYAGGKLAAGCFPGQTIKAQRVTSSWDGRRGQIHRPPPASARL